MQGWRFVRNELAVGNILYKYTHQNKKKNNLVQFMWAAKLSNFYAWIHYTVLETIHVLFAVYKNLNGIPVFKEGVCNYIGNDLNA